MSSEPELVEGGPLKRVIEDVGFDFNRRQA